MGCYACSVGGSAKQAAEQRLRAGLELSEPLDSSAYLRPIAGG